MELPFTIEPDATARLCTLDEWGQIRKEQIVCVRVLDKRRTLLAETIQPLDIERRLPYPQQVGLSMIASADTDTLLLRCEHYARCVSLHGDGFEPLFDDNFFDLLPGETKCIRVLPSPAAASSMRKRRMTKPSFPVNGIRRKKNDHAIFNGNGDDSRQLQL